MEQVALNDVLSRYALLSDAEKQKMEGDLLHQQPDMYFIPNPGPQTEAYYSKADELFFGGSAGCGKTSILCGIPINEHDDGLILRREYKQLTGVEKEIARILCNNDDYNKTEKVRKLPGNRLLQLAAVQYEQDKEKQQGNARDYYGFDEICHFSRTMYKFIIGWNRAVSGKRCRVVCAGNPPLTSVGLWVIDYWGAWIDPKNRDYPTKPGVLRWYTTINGEDVQVDGPGPHNIDGRAVYAKSRTFIPGKLEDNPDLACTGYAASLEAMDEPYRTMLREGRFDLALQDDVKQVIPTSWVQAAMKRWTAKPPDNVPMCAIAADVACGGEDHSVLASRYDFWFSPLISKPGRETPLGSDVAGLITANRKDNAAIVIDMGGGYGGAVYECFLGNIEDKGIGLDKKLYKYMGAEGTTERSDCGNYKFQNIRSAALWRMREALDPDQPGGSPVQLPYDNDLLADLTTPLFEITHHGLEVETKKSVCKRLGRSPDKGDAVVMCNYYGRKGFTPETARNYAAKYGRGGTARPQVVMGRQHAGRKN